MSEISELKEEVSELRQTVEKGFKGLREWQRDTDIILRGNENDDVWGLKQKIKYHKTKLDDHKERILTLEINYKTVMAWVIGAGAGAGLIGGIVFNIVIQLL